MKKINILKKILLVLFIFLSVQNAYSKEFKSLYVVKNAKAADILQEIYGNLENALVDKQNNVIYSNQEKYYYIKVSEEKEDVEIFINSSDKEVQQITDKIKSKAYILNDTSALSKYNDEFKKFAVTNKIGNVKNTKKLNKNGYREYNPYMGKIRNKVLETKTTSQNNITIERKKLKPKTKVKHYANEYVYNVTNNTGKDITIQKVASAEFIGLTQIAAYTVIPRGLDFVPIYGIVYGVQTDLEKNKFTRPHPINETIKSGETMRILALTKSKDNPKADFKFTIDSKELTLTVE